MSELALVIGNKNYSSWSLRADPVMMLTGAIYKKAIVPLDCSNTQKAIRAHSVAGQVPLLFHINCAIWGSLAIAKHLAKQFPHAKLWPADIGARAYACSVSCEIQTGFKALRKHLPMDLRAPHTACLRKLLGGGRTECRCQFGSEEAFLSDQFTIANTFYALIVRRFPTYGIKLAGEVMVYVDALWNSPDMQVWLDDTNVGHWNINNFKV